MSVSSRSLCSGTKALGSYALNRINCTSTFCPGGECWCPANTLCGQGYDTGGYNKHLYPGYCSPGLEYSIDCHEEGAGGPDRIGQFCRAGFTCSGKVNLFYQGAVVRGTYTIHGGTIPFDRSGLCGNVRPDNKVYQTVLSFLDFQNCLC